MDSTQWWSGPSTGTLRSMKTMQAIYFSYQIRLPESLLTVNERNIQFVNNVKYLDVIFDKKITWTSHIKTIGVKTFRAFIRTYSLIRSEQLSANCKVTLHKALIRSIMAYACPAL
jgi:hypothetical protein